MQGVQTPTAMPSTRPPLSPQQLREEASSCATGPETSVSYINSVGAMEQQHMTPDHAALEQGDTACGMYTTTTTSNGAVEMRERVHTPAAMGQPEVIEAFEIQYEMKEDERSGSSKATEEKKSDTNTNTTSLTPTATREKTSGSAHKGVKAFFQRMRGSSDNLLQKDDEKNGGSAHTTPSHKHHNHQHQHNRIMSDDLEDHMLGSAYNAHDICPSCGYPRMSSVWCPVTQRHHGTDELAQSASASGNAGEHHKSHLHWRTNSKNFMSLVKGKFTAGAGSGRRHRPYPVHSTAEGDDDDNVDEAAVEGNDIEDGSPASLSPRCVNKHNHHGHHHKDKDNSSTPTAQSAGAAEALIFDTHAAAMTTQAFSMPVVALMPSLDDAAAVSESNTTNNNLHIKAEEAVMTACEMDVGDEARRRLLGHEPVATVVYCDEDIPSNNNTTNDNVEAAHEELEKSNHEGEEGNTTAAEVKETTMTAEDTEPQYYCYVDEYGNTTYYLATTNAAEADEAQEVFQAEENHANEISFTEEVPGAEKEEVVVQDVGETVAEGASQQPDELHPSPSAIAVNADEKSVSAASVSPSSSSAVAAEAVTRKKSNLAAKIGHFFHGGMSASSSGNSSAKKKKDKKAKSEEGTTPKASPALKPEVLSPALSVHVDPQSAGQTNNTQLLLTTENVTPQPETSATLNTLLPSHATPKATQGETNNAISPSSPEAADTTPGTVSLGGMSVSKGTKQSIKLLEKEEKKAREAIRKSAKEDGEELMRQCRALAVALSNSAPRLRTRKVKKGEPL